MVTDYGVSDERDRMNVSKLLTVHVIQHACSERHYPQAPWKEIFTEKPITKRQFVLRGTIETIQSLHLEHLDQWMRLRKGYQW